MTDNNELYGVIDNNHDDSDSDCAYTDHKTNESTNHNITKSTNSNDLDGGAIEVAIGNNSKKDSSDDNCYDTETNIVDDGTYNRNKSYKVIVNIPDECKKYGIILITNVFTAQINLSLTMSPYLSKK